MDRKKDLCTKIGLIKSVELLRPILFTLEKFQQFFLKIKRRGPPVRDMSRHKLEAIKLLIIATEPVETVF